MKPTTDPASDPLRDWLASPGNQEQLTAIARQLSEELFFRKLPPPFGKEDDQPADPEDIRSELVLFLLERGPRLAPLARCGSSAWVRYLKTAFIRHCIDQARRPSNDGFRYWYKRVARALRGSQRFHLQVMGRNALAFSRQNPADAIPPLSAEDLRDIPFPYEQTSAGGDGGLNRTLTLRRLAGHFWREAVRLWDGRPIWVDLRDFVDWIRRSEPPDAPARRDVPEGVGAHDFNPEQVRTWARQAADMLTGTEAEALRLRYGDGRRLREMAETLGYSGPSGAAYPLRRAEGRLQRFLRDRPWLSPGDLHPEAFALFHDTLLAALADRGKEEAP